MKQKERTFRLQVDLSDRDQRAIEDFQFQERFRTKAAAVRELLRRGLAIADKESQTDHDRKLLPYGTASRSPRRKPRASQ